MWFLENGCVPYLILVSKLSSMAPMLPPLPPRLHQWRGFLVCGNFSSFTAPSQRCRSHLYSFVSVFPFFFCPTQVCGEFLAFWEVWGLLPAFSRYSVGVVPHVDVFLMYCGEEGDLHVLLLHHLEGLLDNFLRTHKTLFHSSCTILYSDQQCMRLPISLHPCQHLLLSVFNLGMLVTMKWYLIVVLIFSSLIMTNNVQHLLCVCWSSVYLLWRFVGHLYIFFGEASTQALPYFFSICLFVILLNDKYFV